ncbi:ADP-ribose pyrophosphatase, mitochondrial isoform X6 [Cimex lectularius]|uniref:Nudix hydrolase domain-containing protein n=1 Tax=Cimex lectularius TaxID=79782 RepID=A0A8I6RS29_CIMLE|nr:ADP-ribose pyrophosphatase, mitochondrial isoform X6 [Cimex lectularius]
MLILKQSISGMCTKVSHFKCRVLEYPKSNVKRVYVPDDKVSWDVSWDDYNPVRYTSSALKNKPWADPDICEENFNPRWNSVDGKVERRSFGGNYKIHNGHPLNPCGRTGLSGRGLLGRWGPNHAADPIVTRWKRENGSISYDKLSGKNIMQFIAIRRGDNNEIAIPGGMVDVGEVVSQTLKREFLEEALNSNMMEDETKLDMQDKLKALFASGVDIYKGYVDDPRNTDNAWMETVAQNFHDEDGSSVSKLNLQAGDDAIGVCWLDISKDLKLYASHSDFIEIVAKRHNAHW